VKYGSRFPNLHFPSKFPVLGDVLTTAGIRRRQVSQGMTALLGSFTRLAPFLPRLVVDGEIAMPLFTVTLQRNTIDVGGNPGQLTIGEMPSDTKVDELTWVPVRNYSFEEGGLPAPPNSPNEVSSGIYSSCLGFIPSNCHSVSNTPLLGKC
jgi:phytepsin